MSRGVQGTPRPASDSTGSQHVLLSRHRRRRLHRIAPRRRARAPRPPRARRRQPDHREAPQPRAPGGPSSSSKATSPTWTVARRAVDGRGLRAAPGRDPVGAAIGAGSDHLEPRQHRRHAERAGRRARRRRPAARLRRVVVGLRRHADAAEARGHADQPALALRAAEAGRRAVPADVHVALRPRNGHDPLLQRLRAAAGSRRRRTRASSRSSRPRCSTGAAPIIYGDGEQTRDFTYVANVVDGVLRACDAPRAPADR